MITTTHQKLLDPLISLGLDPEDITERSALEIAKLSGYTSDRWTRDERSEIESILRQCRNGSTLVEMLKAADGKRYSGFAYQMIRLKQRLSSTSIPVFKDGKLQKDKSGKSKLQKIERQMLPDQFAELIVEKLGAADDSEDDDPDLEAELLPEREPELDPERTSTSIVWQHDETSLGTQLADNNGAIASDTRRTVQGFLSHVEAQFGALGQEAGGVAVQAFLTNFQEQVNQGLSDASQIANPSQAPKTARRSTRKKS